MNTEIDKRHKKIIKELERIWDLMVFDPAQALSDTKEVEKQSEEASFLKGVNDSRFYRAWCYLYLSRFEEALAILSEQAILYENDQLSENNIKVLNALGVAYTNLGDSAKAFFYYSRSLKLSRKADLIDRELSVLNNLGTYYLNNNDYGKALTHYLELLEKSEIHDDSREFRAVVLSNAGSCYYELGEMKKAEQVYQKSLSLAREIKSRNSEASVLFNLGQIRDKIGQSEEAQHYLDRALQTCLDIGNKTLECSINLYLGERNQDIQFFEKALDLSSEINNKQSYLDSCVKLSNFHEKNENFTEAYRFLKEALRVEKELNNQATAKKIHNMELEYEIEKNRKNAEFFKSENRELKESLNWMTLLNQVTKETFSTLDTDSILSNVFKSINRLMDVTHFHIALHRTGENKIVAIKAYENGKEIEPFSFNDSPKESFAGWAIFHKREILVNDIEAEYEKYLDKLTVYGKKPLAKSILTVPVFLRDNEVGALAILSNNRNAYSEEHVQFLKSLATFLSIAIENARNYEKVIELNSIISREKDELEAANIKITELATHDNLTGLINRRVLFEILEASMKQARRRGEILAILFIDLDDFKPINDTYGHSMGDKVLKEVARRLQCSVRSTDSVSRIGGDEFLILLNPIKSRNEALFVCEKILANMGRVMNIDEENFSIDMSIGVSLFSGDSISAEQLIINADSAMYVVKKGNKKGIYFFSDSQEIGS